MMKMEFDHLLLFQHEIGRFDLPATIDYVLKKSNHSQVLYIGHSQGSTSFFVMTSERPDYNEKILLSIHLAPPVFMGHVENELLQLNVRYLDSIEVSEILLFVRNSNNFLLRHLLIHFSYRFQ